MTGSRDRSRVSVVGRELLAIGLQRRPGKDLYHYLLTAPWQRLFLLLVVAYVAANAFFAAGYLLIGDAIEEARPGSFADAFFFSVQTMATIGYGKMAPHGLAANVLVSVEALIGLMAVAVVTGLVFAKFSRPTARVLFSRVAVVAPYDGVPSLMFRMANERASQIVEAQLRVALVRTETTAEGETVRRVHDLHLRRSRSALFALTWTAIHPITAQSPLHGESEASMREREANLVASLTGYDESLAQTIHARHAYAPGEIVWNARFQDLFTPLPDGRPAIDYRRFHEVAPLRGEPDEPQARAGGEQRQRT
jgi:inward rectifier potassium channel